MAGIRTVIHNLEQFPQGQVTRVAFRCWRVTMRISSRTPGAGGLLVNGIQLVQLQCLDAMGGYTLPVDVVLGGAPFTDVLVNEVWTFYPTGDTFRGYIIEEHIDPSL